MPGPAHPDLERQREVVTAGPDRLVPAGREAAEDQKSRVACSVGEVTENVA